ncbi:MAG TPA: hypothetical protein VFI95_25940 [Terriglobales bacterium]|nr:hypothetical protein [Terriglobales bacterium]
MTLWLARNQAALERAEAREMVARLQRHADAMVGKYDPQRLTEEQAERNKRDIAEMLKRYPDLA